MSRLTLVHGFTQTGRSWAPVVPALSGHFEVVTPDLPGHGTRAGQPAGMDEAARILGEEGGRGSYVAYSMGGRVALHLALARPDLVERLVLVSTTAGIEDDEEREARRQADEARAAALEASGLDAFLEEWLAQPLFAGLTPEAAGLDARRENTAEGLAAALRLLGPGSHEPLWRRLFELHMPVLVMAGERDDPYCLLAVQMAGWLGEFAALAMVPDAGHACHLERPQAFVDLVLPFLEEGHDHERHDHERHDHQPDHEHDGPDPREGHDHEHDHDHHDHDHGRPV